MRYHNGCGTSWHNPFLPQQHWDDETKYLTLFWKFRWCSWPSHTYILVDVMFWKFRWCSRPSHTYILVDVMGRSGTLRNSNPNGILRLSYSQNQWYSVQKVDILLWLEIFCNAWICVWLIPRSRSLRAPSIGTGSDPDSSKSGRGRAAGLGATGVIYVRHTPKIG